MLDYALIDFGNGRKLERFGTVILDRPEVIATGQSSLEAHAWRSLAHGIFRETKNAKGSWEVLKPIPEQWLCTFRHQLQEVPLICKKGPYKHVGVFPEQQKHWRFIQEQLHPGDRYLNLFAYTGAATLVAALSGAEAYHVEASKSVVNWAARNASNARVDNVHWVCDDAFKFCEREHGRGNRYKGISMDPPVYGIAKNGRRWRLEDRLEQLINTSVELLEPGGFLVLNTYSPVISLAEMKELIEKNRMQCIDSGWLSVDREDQLRLKLSKFVFAKR